MSKIVGKREKSKEKVKKTIVSSATKRFSSYGVQKSSIAAIMEDAQLGIGTFYNYFESKEMLLSDLLNDFMKETKDIIKQSKKTSAETFEDAIMSMSNHLANNDFIMPLLFNYKKPSYPNRLANVFWQEQLKKFIAVFSIIIVNGQKLGEFRKDIPIEVINEMIYSIFHSSSISPMNFKDNMKIKTKILINGFKK